jgi:hypothetical protein
MARPKVVDLATDINRQQWALGIQEEEGMTETPTIAIHCGTTPSSVSGMVR